METTSPAAARAKKGHPSPQTNNPPPKTSCLARHERLCSICQHPRREDIDDDILRWRSPDDIACEFKLGDRATIYRHGRALNLFTQRKKNLNPALERLIESVYDAKPSAGVILKAMAIYARVNGNEAYKLGFTDPPKHTVITHLTVRDESATTSTGSVGAPPCPEVRRTYPDSSKDAAPFSNPAQSIHPEERGTTQGSPAGAREEAVTVIEPPTSDLKPPDSRTAIEMIPIHFADGPAEAVLKKHPELKRFVLFGSAFIPIVLLGWLFWTAFLGIGSTVSAAAVSSTWHSAAVLATKLPPHPLHPQPPMFYSPPVTSHSLALRCEGPLPYFYPPQNVQSENANSLKMRPKSISYPPQKRSFLRGQPDVQRYRRRTKISAPLSDINSGNLGGIGHGIGPNGVAERHFSSTILFPASCGLFGLRFELAVAG